ncbi:uncharacterized protein LOC110096591 [Dendrobium catenatum]|nr:uncharacterized protein LOC110096591 [Dendrobium catenatum]XP_020678281.1 uncharacterized protein LOC110096591 [Dendrobium catenatum]
MGDTVEMEGGCLRSEDTLSCISSHSSIPSLDLSSCHRCGLRFPISDSIDQFRTLESQWRIVLLCYDCLDGVRSAKVCSYCFSAIPELEKGILVCIECCCRVHCTCVPLHHRNLSPSQLDTEKFICVDCCPVYRFRGEGVAKSGSRTGFSILLEDLVREANSISEKEMASEVEAKNNMVSRSMAVRSSTEVTKDALASVHLVKDSSNAITLADEELALRLHRSINGSQRISRTFWPKDKTRLRVLGKVRESNCSVVRVVDSNSCVHHVKIEACSENKFFVDGKIEVCSDNKSHLEGMETSQSIMTSSLLEPENGDLLKQVRGYETEGLENFFLKDKDIIYMSPDSTSDCSNVGPALFPMNSLLNNTMPLTKFRFDVGEGSSLQRKAIDEPGSDMCTKKYFRRQWGSRRFVVGG